jgi:hypothetical protein
MNGGFGDCPEANRWLISPLLVVEEAKLDLDEGFFRFGSSALAEHSVLSLHLSF